MEEFNQSKMVSMNNTWDIPLTMEDPIIQSNYCHSISNQIRVPLSSTVLPLWSSFLVQSSHQHQALSSAVLLPRYAECAARASIDQLEEVGDDDDPEEELGPEKEMTYRIAAMQPVDIDPSTIHKPKRRNVWISEDPQSVAARQRRERISEKIQILQRLVPGGTKMDTATMLDEAVHYVKFLKRLVRSLQSSLNHQNNSHLQWIPSIPILFGDPLQILQADKPIVSSSSSSSMEHFITWSGNSGGDANIHFNHEVTGSIATKAPYHDPSRQDYV